MNQNNIDYYVDEQGDCQYHLPFQYIMQHNDDDGDMNHHNYMYMNHHPHQLQSNQQQHQQQHPFIEQQHETHSNSHSHQIQPTHSQHLKHVQFYPQQIIHQQEFYGISNNDNNTEEIEHIEHIEQINDILPRQQSNHRQLSDSNKSNVSNQSYSSSSKPSINHSNSNPNSNPYYPNFNSFSSDDNGNKNISDTDKYQQDIQSLPSSLFKNQLDWNVILHLLNNKDDVLTALLKNNIKYKQNDNDDNEEDNDLMINKNDTLDSTDTVVDNEEQYESKYDNIQYDANNNNKQWPYDNDNDDLKDIDDDPSATNIMFDLKDQLEKYSFVARYNNELVFVKITKTDQYREKLILNIKKNEMLSSWWNDTDDDTDDLDEMPPFLQLRGWYLDDCSPLACIMYPFATKFSQYLNNQIIRNSDFAAFEKFENKEEQNKINWSVNDYHMDNIRNILSKLAIFIANLHAEDVSHRGITMDNLFIDNNIHKQQIYLINYAQNRFVDDLYLSPEGHQCKKNDDLSYSLTANDVWSFGCILLNIFGTNSNQYIQDFINYPYLLYNPNEVQRRLQLCLGIKDFSNQYEQTKLKSLLVLLLNIFTTENQRVDIEFVCQHPFLCNKL